MLMILTESVHAFPNMHWQNRSNVIVSSVSYIFFPFYRHASKLERKKYTVKFVDLSVNARI